MSRFRPTHFVPVLALSLPVAVTVACYGPTEVTVTISTDLPCSEGPRTAIYKGPPIEDAPDAETETCTTVPNGDAEIGSLVFLPSGDADGRAAVKAVLARNRSITDCDAHPEDCIVATRSFSFVKHLSRRVPIRMLSACLGKRCPDGQTCGRGGVCISNEVTCATGDCELEAEPPGGDVTPPVSDAGGADVVVDAKVPPVPGACSGPDGNGVLAQGSGTTGMPGAMQAAFGDGVFHFLDPLPQPRIMRVTTAGGAPVEAFPLPGPDGTLIALAMAGSGWIAAHDRVVGPTTPVQLSSSLPGAPGPLDTEAVTAIAPAKDADGQAVYVANTTSVIKVVFGRDPEVFTKTSGGARIAVDSTTVYLSRQEGIEALDRSNVDSKLQISLVPDPASNVLAFGTDGSTVFAGGFDKGVAKILALNGLVQPVTVIEPGGPVVSLTADATHVYWTDGGVIKRIGKMVTGNAKLETVFEAGPNEKVGHLAVDASCLYFWSEPPGLIATGVLRVAPKSAKP